MKRLMVVGGLAAVMLAVAASQHSPPAVTQALQPQAVMAQDLPSFEPVATIDTHVIKVTVGQHILVPRASLRNLEAMLKPRSAPRLKTLALPIGITYKHVSNTSMRGWGFL